MVYHKFPVLYSRTFIQAVDLYGCFYLSFLGEFSLEVQIVNILSFANPVVSITTIPSACRCSMKATTDSI